MGKSNKILLRLRDRDTQAGVTRGTLTHLAKVLGINETDAIHKSLAESAQKYIPQYEQDDGPLTSANHRRIEEEVRRGGHGEFRITSHLFEKTAREPAREPRKSVRSTSRPR